MPGRIELTADQRRIAAERYAEGETIAVICSALGVGRAVVARTLKADGVKLQRGPRAGSQSAWGTKGLDDTLAPRIIDGYRSGLSRRALAVEFGTYPQQIERILVAAGVTLRDDRQRRHERSPIFKGGRRRLREGYVTVLLPPGHEMASMCHSRGDVLEHRLVMAEHLGRPLFPHERVHHLNGDRADNRIENLELWEESHPPGQRHHEAQHRHCPTCTCRS